MRTHIKYSGVLYRLIIAERIGSVISIRLYFCRLVNGLEVHHMGINIEVVCSAQLLVIFQKLAQFNRYEWAPWYMAYLYVKSTAGQYTSQFHGGNLRHFNADKVLRILAHMFGELMVAKRNYRA